MIHFSKSMSKHMALLVFVLGAYFQGYAEQDSARVTIHESRISIEEAFRKIEAQTGVMIFYARAHLNGKEVLSNVSFSNIRITEALGIILQGKGVTWSFVGKGIAITKRQNKGEPPPAPGAEDTLQQPAIRGTVTADDGQVLPGATVQVKGTGIGTTTNKNGQFALKAVSQGAVVVISYTGYVPQEFTVQPPEILVVRLKQNTESLDEQVVIAYGTSSKRRLTGSVSRITAEQIRKQPVSNPLAAMIGRMPGVQIVQNSGIPGGDFKIQIRGRNSISQGNDPFYIVDGVPFSSSTLSTNMSTIINGGNPLNNINPADIESIEVLKDADATAIYGSRGANGVVLITTKKGKAGKTSIDVSAYHGIAKVPKFLKLLSTEQYLAMRREAFDNDGVTITPTTPNTSDLNWDNKRYTDWQKVLIGGTAGISDAQFNLSGGSTSTQFFLSGGIHRETTVFPGSFADTKLTGRFGVNHSSNDQRFKLQFSGGYTDDDNRLNRSDLTNIALTLPPNAPKIYNAEGMLNWENDTWDNPYAETLKEYVGSTNNFIANAIVSYQIFKGLVIRSSLGYTSMRMQEVNTLPLSTFRPGLNRTSTTSQFNDNSIKTWIAEPQVEYGKTFGKLKLNALIGSTFQQNLRQGQMIQGTGYTSDALLKDMKSAASLAVFSSNYWKYRYNALFGRLNLEWGRKYILNITGRRDGSSRFGPGRQFSNFGAIGGAWILSNETWLPKNRILSFAKIRGSYGTTGNDQILDYGYIDLWVPTTNAYLGVKGLYSNNLFNATYSWERNKKAEVAIELGFLQDKILLTSGYYFNRSNNQLVATPLPRITGFTSINDNRPATVDNKGWEFDLTATVLNNKAFKWTVAANLTIPKSELVAYPGFEQSLTAPFFFTIGYPLNVAKAYNYAGVNTQTGVYEFKKQDGTLSSLPSIMVDRTISYSLLPDYYGGLQSQLAYKGISIDFLFQFSKQLGMNELAGFATAPGFMGNKPSAVMERWRKPGDVSEVQMFTQSTASTAYRAYNNVTSNGSNKYSDASFIRLKNLSISYNLPDVLAKSIKANLLRVYLQAQNLFTITDYEGLDPETQSVTRLPTLRVLTAGFQVSF